MRRHLLRLRQQVMDEFQHSAVLTKVLEGCFCLLFHAFCKHELGVTAVIQSGRTWPGSMGSLAGMCMPYTPAVPQKWAPDPADYASSSAVTPMMV